MAYYLQFDGVDDYCTIASPITLSGEFSIRIQILYKTGDNQVFIGNPSTTDDVIRFNSSTQMLVKLGGSSETLSFSAALVDGQFYDFYLQRDSSNELNIVDASGASLINIPVTNSADFDLHGFGKISIGQFFGGGIAAVSLYDNAARTTLLNHWENTTGTGSTLPDSVASNDATLVNFPTDDSQWVSYGAADTSAPTVTSASVPTAGDTIAVQMSEAMQVGAGGTGGWTISLGDATISAAAVDGTDDTIINLTPSRTLLSGETFTIGYTQPGDGFQDQATTPNDLATLSGQAVTNNSTQTATLSISAADSITSEGQTATFTLANNSGAPTGATLNGTDVGVPTLVSGSTYSYPAPLIPDDATADLVVSVDSTTVSTQISYANSYPYVLTNHGTPQPNSVMEGNQFATTQPVELKVITDTDAAIADIDWQAMSDNQQWLTDIRNASSVTSVADGTTSFTLGYYVQETGATGTFERTVTTTDTLSPAIDSVSVPTAGTYHAGDVLSFTVNWNENVTVTGTPALNLNIGGSAGQANYASGSTTAALVFTYTVQAGDVDADGIAVSSLTLDGGTIKDGAGNDAYLTLNSVGDTSGVLVDADGAVIQSVAVPTAGTYVPGNALDFTVTFEAAVTVTGTPELVLDIGGEARPAAYISGSTTTALVFRYTVASGDLDADGIGISSLSLAGGTIKDQYSVDANLALNSVADTSGVLVDGVGPAISVNSLTTLDTAPIVSGSAGDATSLTLVVTGVGTYNPVPSAGSWSQQLPTLALGDYTMTLNGQDSAGNSAIEANATLSVVEEILSGEGLFRSIFTPQGIELFRTLFR